MCVRKQFFCLLKFPPSNVSVDATLRTMRTERKNLSQWDDSDNGPRTGGVSLRAASDNRPKSRHQYFKENISKTSLNLCNKTKSKNSEPFVTSDPRFKRIIPPGNQTDVGIGTTTKKSKSTLDVQNAFKSKPTNWTPPEFKPKQPTGDSAENTEKGKSNPLFFGCELECKNTNPTDTLKHEQSQDNLKLVEKLGFNHSLVESFSKESISDSCLSTRNASLASEESGPDFSKNLEPCPSAARVKKVQNWIQEQQGKPEKKQSVVTVIGQTQGSDTLSSALQEIDKRRKLVKQLDKYAVCRKILDPEKDNEISELFARINCLTQAGKTWFCGDSNDDTKMNFNGLKGVDDCLDKFSNISDNERVVPDEKAKARIYEPESVKRKAKKGDIIADCSVKGSTRLFLNRVPYQWLFCVLIFLCVVLCGIMYITIQRNRYVSFDLFTPKPKPLSWYEKICMWIWELFRPSANYQRTAPWQQYLN